MTTSEALLLVMSVVVLLMGIVVDVMLWQSSRRLRLSHLLGSSFI